MDVIRPVFTVEDLAHLPDNGNLHEILQGDLAVSPSPKPRHQRVVLNCADFFRALEHEGYGEVYTAPLDVVLDRYNVVEPDLIFIRTDRLAIVTDANVQGAPDLVVEVLSLGTRDRDLGVKAHLHARFGVNEYWVVDPDDQTLTIYRLTAEGYQRHGPYRASDNVVSPLFSDKSLIVAGIFRA
ncbi:MAG: Uma2 family endonuclease [Thermaerobacter sp.]|nr:Uma2 family endonuclease [Thermaerobacter sp.]